MKPVVTYGHNFGDEYITQWYYPYPIQNHVVSFYNWKETKHDDYIVCIWHIKRKH